MVETADTIKLSHFYSHSPEEVWKALSDEKAISKWFIQADFQPLVGYVYTFTHETTTITGEVLVANPPERLSYTWIVSGTAVSTVVTWDLQEKDGGTELTITHSGIEKYGDSAINMFNSFKQGWGHCISELETYLQ